jgi:hypothetical protein
MSRTVTLGVCLAAAVVVAAGTASAIPLTGSSTDVSFVPIAEHAVLTNAYVFANGVNSPVVIGGTTTVPSDATRVQLRVSVKGSASGSLRVYPAGDLSDAQNDVAHWTSTKVGTATVGVSAGTSDRVSFVNVSARPINLSVTITGYSTQVAVGDVNGFGGTPGQVLTDTGIGAAWQTPGSVYTLSQRGSFITTLYATPGVLHVPAGTYLVEATGTIADYQQQDSTVQCGLLNGATNADDDTAWASVTTGAPDASIALHAVATLSIDDEFVALRCSSPAGALLRSYTLTAVPIGTVHVEPGS